MTTTDPVPAALKIGDTGHSATEFVAFYDEQLATLARQLFAAAADSDSPMPDAEHLASQLDQIARLQALRDLWERAAAGDPHPDGGTRGGTTVEAAWRTAVRAALRALRRDNHPSNPAQLQVERAQRAAAHQWLTDMRTQKALDPAMVLELL